MCKKGCFVFGVLFLILSCQKEENIDKEVLQNYLQTKESIAEEVIACAASSKERDKVLVYFFPETNTSDYRLYLLNNDELGKGNYEGYERNNVISEIKVANTLRAFALDIIEDETWAVVSFEKNNQIHYSNPIHLKHQKSPTIYHDEIEIENISFMWEDTLANDGEENAIFFEIISDEQNELISGTYTYENQYTYLDNSNVVLTITPNNTTVLENNTDYNFAVMGVSEDNWVGFIGEKSFKVK